jgi:biotin operon repressor
VEVGEPQQRQQKRRQGLQKTHGSKHKQQQQQQYGIIEERRRKVLELNKASQTAGQISRTLGIPPTTVQRDLKHLKRAGFEVQDNSKKYLENDKWYKVIERTKQELDFYTQQDIVPTAPIIIFDSLNNYKPSSLHCIIFNLVK